jgi:hypothetical protein
MKSSIKVEGVQELCKQFPEFVHDVLKASNTASIESMDVALSSVKMTNRFQDRGRRNDSKGNKAHPPGFLRSKFKLFKIDSIKKGKLRVWATVGVPYGEGAAYYIPLALGHTTKGKPVKKREFFEDAWSLASERAKTKVVTAINAVINRYTAK